jgi:hypothetical protein
MNIKKIRKSKTRTSCSTKKWKALQQEDYTKVVHELSYGTDLIQNLTWFQVHYSAVSLVHLHFYNSV